MAMMQRMSLIPSHQKVYNGETFPTLDRWFYICLSCGEVGSDKLKEPPEIQAEEYWRHMRRMKPDCWVPRKYTDKM